DAPTLSVSTARRGYVEFTLTTDSGLVANAAWRLSRFFEGAEGGLVLAVPDVVSVGKYKGEGNNAKKQKRMIVGMALGTDLDITDAGRPVVRNLEVPAVLREK